MYARGMTTREIQRVLLYKLLKDQRCHPPDLAGLPSSGGSTLGLKTGGTDAGGKGATVWEQHRSCSMQTDRIDQRVADDREQERDQGAPVMETPVFNHRDCR
jgi:hypothetical protein